MSSYEMMGRIKQGKRATKGNRETAKGRTEVEVWMQDASESERQKRVAARSANRRRAGANFKSFFRRSLTVCPGLGGK